MAIQMTRAEYEAKYGAQVPATTPIPVQMTQAEYDAKYPETPKQPDSILKTIFGEKSGVNFPKRNQQLSDSGTNIFSGIKNTNLKQVGTGIAQGVSGVVGPVADVINTAVIKGVEDIGKGLANTYKNTLPESIRTPIANTMSKAVNYPVYEGSSIKNITKDTLQGSIKDFGTTTQTIAPEGSFTNAALGAVSDVLNVLPVKSVVKKAYGVTEDLLNTGYNEVKKINLPSISSSPEKVINNRVKEIAKIEGNYAATRKANNFSKDAGNESRKRVANTDVLVNAVDDTGTIRTTGPGGAIEQYKALTVDNAENIVRNNLSRLSESVNLNKVKSNLTKSVYDSGLEGSDLTNALNNVRKEIEGYALKADANGNIPLTTIHDAKISTTKGINFQTPPEIKTYRKAIAKGLKETVEKSSKFNVKEVNSELSKYLEDIKLLERLDGKKVRGGKLGKYFAQISGNIVGAVAGSAVGGPVGSAIGTIVGGELAGKIKGSALSKTLGKATGFKPEQSEILKKAIEESKLPKVAKLYSNKVGNLKPIYNKTINPSIIPIKSNILPKVNKVKLTELFDVNKNITKAFSGIPAGITTDENGNITYNPIAGLVGGVGMIKALPKYSRVNLKTDLNFSMKKAIVGIPLKERQNLLDKIITPQLDKLPNPKTDEVIGFYNASGNILENGQNIATRPEQMWMYAGKDTKVKIFKKQDLELTGISEKDAFGERVFKGLSKNK